MSSRRHSRRRLQRCQTLLGRRCLHSQMTRQLSGAMFREVSCRRQALRQLLTQSDLADDEVGPHLTFNLSEPPVSRHRAAICFWTIFRHCGVGFIGERLTRRVVRPTVGYYRPKKTRSWGQRSTRNSWPGCIMFVPIKNVFI